MYVDNNILQLYPNTLHRRLDRLLLANWLFRATRDGIDTIGLPMQLLPSYCCSDCEELGNTFDNMFW